MMYFLAAWLVLSLPVALLTGRVLAKREGH